MIIKEIGLPIEDSHFDCFYLEKVNFLFQKPEEEKPKENFSSKFNDEDEEDDDDDDEDGDLSKYNLSSSEDDE